MKFFLFSNFISDQLNLFNLCAWHAVCGIQQDDIFGWRHTSLRQHWSSIWSAGWVFLCSHGLLLRENMESHTSIQDWILPAVSWQGKMACRDGSTTRPLFQCRHVRIWTQSIYLPWSPQDPQSHPSNTFRRTRLSQHVF